MTTICVGYNCFFQFCLENIFLLFLFIEFQTFAPLKRRLNLPYFVLTGGMKYYCLDATLLL